jgi:hypothetical protein
MRKQVAVEARLQFAPEAPATPKDILMEQARACLGYLWRREGK